MPINKTFILNIRVYVQSYHIGLLEEPTDGNFLIGSRNRDPIVLLTYKHSGSKAFEHLRKHFPKPAKT